MGGGPLLARLIGPATPLIAWRTERYIAHHRARLLPKAKPMDANLQDQLRGFFPVEILRETQTVHATLPNPRFYSVVRKLGITGLLEMSSIGAIALMDVIAYPEPMTPSTVFHELVHAVQYRVLGLRRFARLYVRGFLDKGGYPGIPLERQAYELEKRFSRSPQSGFSVEDEVVRRLEAGGL